jgi:hypothetical protein
MALDLYWQEARINLQIPPENLRPGTDSTPFVQHCQRLLTFAICSRSWQRSTYRYMNLHTLPRNYLFTSFYEL